MEKLLTGQYFRQIAENVIQREKERKDSFDKLAMAFKESIKRYIYLEQPYIKVTIFSSVKKDVVDEFITNRHLEIESRDDNHFVVSASPRLSEKRSMINHLYSDLKILATKAAKKGEFEFELPYWEEEWEYMNGDIENPFAIREHIFHFGFAVDYDSINKSFIVSF